MTPDEFCCWLWGYLELTEPSNMGEGITVETGIISKKVEIIRIRLRDTFLKMDRAKHKVLFPEQYEKENSH